jgi:glycosyltransferase involved in cell wall biosynthesis
VSGTDLPPVEPAQGSVACVIPAKDEVERIVATVDAVRKIAGVDLVVVVDDGSTDGTAEAAERAGAIVVRHPRNRGKAAAMETGAAAVAKHDGAGAGAGAQARHLLFLDADLADSATGAEPLIEPVLAGRADMTIGTLPPQVRADGSKVGGHGFVVRLARSGIEQATGWAPEQPLSGQRCLTRVAFEAALPLAPGFGVEAALSIDLGRKGFRIIEVPVDVRHRASGTDLRGQLHRARQYLHLRRALSARSALPTRGSTK